MRWNGTGRIPALRLAVALSMALFCLAAPFAALRAGESAEAKKKKEAEEAFRKQALDLVSAKVGVKEGEGILSVDGRFTMTKDQARDDKPPPKVVGYIASKGAAFPVIAPTLAVINALSGFDGKDVTLSGKILDKGDEGKFLVVSEVILPPSPPPLKRKRGGLP